jgi:hypothetical protein
VSSTAIVRGDEFVLIDPQAPSDAEERERFWRAVDGDVEHHGPPNIVLTVPWHVRSSVEVAARYEDTRLWVYEDAPDEEGVDPTDTFGLRDELPGGMRAFAAGWENEVELWLPEHRALVFGDAILGAGDGVRLCPESWLDGTLAQLKEELRPLLELPVERLLVSHGEPVLQDGHAALARVLA